MMYDVYRYSTCFIFFIKNTPVHRDHDAFYCAISKFDLENNVYGVYFYSVACKIASKNA